jgi:peptidyl-prolyl cis-trans isomerase D
MISWIQRSFQRHFKVVFGVILAVTVLSFIFTIGSTPGVGRAEHTAVTQDFFGHNLASQEEMARDREDARMSAALRYGGAVSADQMDLYMLQRLAALHLADEMHIPQTSPDELKQFIEQLRMFQGQDGRFDASRYESFRLSIKSGGRSEDDIVRVLRDDVRINKIEIYVGGPGYVMPRDVAEIVLKSDTSWTLSIASLSYADFDPGIRLTDAEISKFFEDNKFRYTIPPKVSADYISFPAADYVKQESATDAEVRQYYNANPAKFPKPAAEKAPAKPDPAADFAAAEPKAREDLLLDKARRESIKVASDLAYALYEGKVARGPALDSFLAERKLKATPLAPFTLEAGPAELEGSHEIANAAFELNANRYYSEAMPTSSGAAVLIWRESQPSREPLLAEVRDKVAADARENEKRERFIAFGQQLRASIVSRLKSGETFDKAAAAAAAPVKLDEKSYPAFTIRTQPQGLDPTVMAALDHLDKGAVSEMQTSGDKGYFVYAADKKEPALDPSNPRFMQVWGQLSMTYARTDSVGILGDIVDREDKRSKPAPR